MQIIWAIGIGIGIGIGLPFSGQSVPSSSGGVPDGTLDFSDATKSGLIGTVIGV